MSPVFQSRSCHFAARGDRSTRWFYGLLWWGRRTERWIDLFAAADRIPPPAADDDWKVDDFVDRLERLVIDEYGKGGMTASAKDSIDRALDRVQIRSSERSQKRSVR